MTPTEFRSRVIVFEKQIERNKAIRCPLVAARYERQLAELKREYESQTKLQDGRSNIHK